MNLKLLCGAAATLALLIATATRSPRADTPCNPYLALTRTGTLLEIREGDRVVGSDEVVRDETPPFVCVTVGPEGSVAVVNAADCWLPAVKVRAVLP